MAKKQPERYIGETEKNLSRLQEGKLDEWITTAEAVQLSSYHPDTIRELLRDGKINGQKFGIVWQVSRQSLIEFLHHREVKGAKRGPKKKLLE